MNKKSTHRQSKQKIDIDDRRPSTATKHVVCMLNVSHSCNPGPARNMSMSSLDHYASAINSSFQNESILPHTEDHNKENMLPLVTDLYSARNNQSRQLKNYHEQLNSECKLIKSSRAQANCSTVAFAPSKNSTIAVTNSSRLKIANDKTIQQSFTIKTDGNTAKSNNSVANSHQRTQVNLLIDSQRVQTQFQIGDFFDACGLPEMGNCSTRHSLRSIIQEEIQPSRKKTLPIHANSLAQIAAKSDQLTSALQQLRLECHPISTCWAEQFACQQSEHQSQLKLKEINASIEQQNQTIIDLKTSLFDLVSRDSSQKKARDLTRRNRSTQLVEQALNLHADLKRRAGHRVDFQTSVIFNMKVVIPNGGTPYMGGNEAFLYEQMFKSGVCKKYSMILKKELLGLGEAETKALSEYFRKLYQLELHYQQQMNSVFEMKPPCEIERVITEIERSKQLLDKLKQTSQQLQSVYESLCLRRKEIESKGETFINDLSQQLSKDFELISGQKTCFYWRVRDHYACRFDDYFKIMLTKSELNIQLEQMK